MCAYLCLFILRCVATCVCMCGTVFMYVYVPLSCLRVGSGYNSRLRNLHRHLKDRRTLECSIFYILCQLRVQTYRLALQLPLHLSMYEFTDYRVLRPRHTGPFQSLMRVGVYLEVLLYLCVFMFHSRSTVLPKAVSECNSRFRQFALSSFKKERRARNLPLYLLCIYVWYTKILLSL